MDCELLSPAGDFDTALAAYAAGADAVYCGLADFSARAFAKNFTFADLTNIVRYAHARGKRVYVTFNTLLDEDAVKPAVEALARLEEIGPDALIVQDIGVARLCRKHFPAIVLHASTQLVAHNLEGVLALKELGFARVVLVRELSLTEIRSIACRCGGLELECFIHGALCYSISGLCLFSAMEKNRSGNRGKCAYCCRLPYADEKGEKVLPFSMKDLRLGEEARKLVAAGVISLKIEGRMKSALYVASVTRYYRQILDGMPADVTTTDLETVFSRRTTELYVNGKPSESVIDPESLGHLGALIGIVKKVTKDRDGLMWLRFHTSRALEKHDGLQFEAMADGKHLGIGITEMRASLSRRPVFDVSTGTDVEVLLPDGEGDFAAQLRPGMKIYCSMSNAVKRRFPVPSFRPSDYAGSRTVDIAVSLNTESIAADDVILPTRLIPAKNPEKTFAAVEKAFSKLGDTNYRLGRLTLNDPDRLFAPMSLLNDLRRAWVERRNGLVAAQRTRKIEAALADEAKCSGQAIEGGRLRIRLRVGQKLPAGTWDEVVLVISTTTGTEELAVYAGECLRLALPVYTPETEFNKLRTAVKRLLRAGFTCWEASDLATLRLLNALGVTDITSDWTLYAFNASTLAQLTELGVRRFVASPENGRENLQFLAESGYDVEFLKQQSTPLFISLTQPAIEKPRGLTVFRQGGLWVTTRPVPRNFDIPDGVSTRLDLSWDPE